jgi:uncharacterized protein (TIGR02246 family)
MWLLLSACGTVHHMPPPAPSARDAVQTRLSQYEAFLQKMDYVGIASMYAEDGELAQPNGPSIRGPAAVRTFLESFRGFKVLRAEVVADTTDIMADRAIQIGRYAQRVTLPDGQTVEVNGHLRVEWKQGQDGVWYVRKMETWSGDRSP